MYLDYFGLRQKPFLITPDPAFLHLGQGHREALAHLHYGLQREGGFLLLSGEVGTGKTTLCRLLMDNLPETFRLAYLLNTKLDSAGLLAGICRELDIPLAGGAVGVDTLVAHIHDNLLAAHAANRHTLVVIEEAQNLTPEVLETLRLLTNLETSTTKLLHILLIGQPELLETLRLPGLRQLNQRVVARAHLGPLQRGELPAYFRHRLRVAGCDRPLFSAGAIRLIHRKTGGIPRLVNLLAEHCLTGTYALGRPLVNAAVVRGAARELRATLQAPRASRSWAWPAAAALALVLAVAWYLLTPGFAPLPAGLADLGPQPAAVAEEAVEEVTAPPPVAEAAVVPPADAAATQAAPGAIARLLTAWGLRGDAASVTDLCRLAAASQLRCETLAGLGAEDVRAINRPLLVTLAEGDDSLALHLVVARAGSELTLANSTGERILNIADTLELLRGETVFLWRPPPGYARPLAPGAVNPPLVELIVARLRERGYLDEGLVTGGLYSDYLGQRVAAFQADRGLEVDGILGYKTLLQLQQGEPGEPLLAVEEE